MATNDIQIRNDDGEFVSIFPIPISQGGTGATATDAARTNLRACGIEDVVTSAYIGQQESSSQGCRIIVGGPVGGRTIFFNESGNIGYYDNEQGKTLWSYPSQSKLEAYPVGSIYLSALPTSPATRFGGTWAVINGGQYLRFGGGWGTGGRSDNKIQNTNLPKLGTRIWNFCGQSNGTALAIGTPSGYTQIGSADGDSTMWYATNHSSWDHTDGFQLKFGGGSAYYPAYQNVYAWRRTA